MSADKKLYEKTRCCVCEASGRISVDELYSKHQKDCKEIFVNQYEYKEYYARPAIAQYQKDKDAIIEKLKRRIFSNGEVIENHLLYNEFASDAGFLCLSEKEFYKQIISPASAAIDWQKIEEEDNRKDQLKGVTELKKELELLRNEYKKEILHLWKIINQLQEKLQILAEEICKLGVLVIQPNKVVSVVTVKETKREEENTPVYEEDGYVKKFAKIPDTNILGFSEDRLQNKQGGEIVYELYLLDNEGFYKTSGEIMVQKLVITSGYDVYLKMACRYLNTPRAGNGFHTVTKGRLEKRNNNWLITEKAVIEFR